MKKREVVKNSRDFEKIIKEGFSYKNSLFVLYYMDNNSNNMKFGISVGKKIGNAVNRNYYKRIIRNICDINKKNYSNGKDYIIIMRKGCIGLSYDELNKGLNSLFIKIKEKKINEKEN